MLVQQKLKTGKVSEDDGKAFKSAGTKTSATAKGALEFLTGEGLTPEERAEMEKIIKQSALVFGYEKEYAEIYSALDALFDEYTRVSETGAVHAGEAKFRRVNFDLSMLRSKVKANRINLPEAPPMLYPESAAAGAGAASAGAGAAPAPAPASAGAGAASNAPDLGGRRKHRRRHTRRIQKGRKYGLRRTKTLRRR
jgi:hypothetical protein